MAMDANLHVLMIEDVEDDALLAEETLRLGGYTVIAQRVDTAATLDVALTGQPWDLILCDYSMPHFSGLGALALVRQRGLDLPFILLSGAIGEETAVEALKAGADDYIMKGNPARLVPSVQRALREVAERLQRRQAEEALHASEALHRTLVETSPDAIALTDLQVTIVVANRRAAELWHDEDPAALVGRALPALVVPGERPRLGEDLRAVGETGRLSNRDYMARRHDGTTFPIEIDAALVRSPEGQPSGIMIVVRDISARKQAEAAIRFQAHLLDTVGQAVTATDVRGIVTYWNRYAEKLYGWTAEEAVGKQISEVLPAPSGQALAEAIFARLATGQEWLGEQLHRHRDGRTFPAQVTTTSVFDEQGVLIGGVVITADITAQKLAEAEIQQHLERISALRTIDMAITASLDLRVTLSVVLDQVTAQLGVHAAAVLLLNPHTQVLEYAAGRGVRGRAVTRARLRLGEGLAGRAALEHRMIAIPDLTLSGEEFSRVQMRDEEGIVAYFAVPLLAKGFVKGVLELWHRAPLEPAPEWVEFLEALAGQAAIAMDNTALFDSLQRSNIELALAYDTTIEGWSRALDLRDRETEGHSQRVTEMTVVLARTLGMSDAELVHVRRGALLHDIGKMAIPDAILLKPGPLTADEWQVVRRHPDRAYELLAPIAYLRLALDIPYCHHEKWDGTGYPRGLTGEQIPLSARAFALADVWDALRSDRPYRPAWPVERVRAHINSLVGTHFDPRITSPFLAMDGEP